MSEAGSARNREYRYPSLDETQRILGYLRDQMGMDFTHYSEASVRRRLAKIMHDNQLNAPGELITSLQQKVMSREDFLDGFLVKVTEMFRDPECFVTLRKSVLSRLAMFDEINIWCAGCSTGQEVISLCIMLDEMNLLDRSRILATDLSRSALQQATNARYGLQALDDYQRIYEQIGGSSRLAAYYHFWQGQVCFHKYLLRPVRFQTRDVAGPPPGQLFDLILCRNVLIYFDALLQNKVFANFDQSLRQGGFLMLGSRESLVFYQHHTHFQEIKRESRIYQKGN